jgi:dTDP-4-dehydrorhamnose 3,5-epimerase
MKVLQKALNGLFIFEHTVFEDQRGFFYESFNKKIFDDSIDSQTKFVQDNHSLSNTGVLRGLHYQTDPCSQGKLVRVISGSVLDVAVDLRLSSPSFGKYFKKKLTSNNRLSMWIPKGFAHGFLSLEDDTEFLYKTTSFYSPNNERTIKYDDTQLNIDWEFNLSIIQSESDTNALSFNDAEYFK